MRNKRSVVWWMLYVTLTFCLWLIPATEVTCQSSQSVDKAELAKNLIVKIIGGNTSGAGIIFSQSGDTVFIATANHVVRRKMKEAQDLRVEFQFWPEEIEATLLKKYDSDLDVAVLLVNLQKSNMTDELFVSSVPFDQLSYISDVQEGIQLYPVGHPPGLDWLIPPDPSQVVSALGDERILLYFQCDQGYSGGGVFDEQWNLVGMIRAFNPPLCEIIGFERIQKSLEAWRMNVHLKPGESAIMPTPLPTAKPTNTPSPQNVTTTVLPKNPKAGDEWTEPTTGMEFVWVPGGCFQMGQTKQEKEALIKEFGEKQYQIAYKMELPRHRVCLDGFWMGKYEVTNAQYRKWKSTHDSTDYEGQSLNGESQPVVYIGWEDANAFTKWLTERYKENPPLPLPEGERYRFRLPTEAEWEYAARAGTITSRYWGDDPNQACQYANVHDQTSKRVNKFETPHHECDDGYAVTASVGNFSPNPFGLYDMLGNVFEWCQDWRDREYYMKRISENPQGPSSGLHRVARGCAWVYEVSYCRSAFRGGDRPGDRSHFVGFRLVRTP